MPAQHKFINVTLFVQHYNHFFNNCFLGICSKLSTVLGTGNTAEHSSPNLLLHRTCSRQKHWAVKNRYTMGALRPMAGILIQICGLVPKKLAFISSTEQGQDSILHRPRETNKQTNPQSRESHSAVTEVMRRLREKWFPVSQKRQGSKAYITNSSQSILR